MAWSRIMSIATTQNAMQMVWWHCHRSTKQQLLLYDRLTDNRRLNENAIKYIKHGIICHVLQDIYIWYFINLMSTLHYITSFHPPTSPTVTNGASTFPCELDQQWSLWAHYCRSHYGPTIIATPLWALYCNDHCGPITATVTAGQLLQLSLWAFHCNGHFGSFIATVTVGPLLQR